jgi:hypothetical protein
MINVVLVKTLGKPKKYKIKKDYDSELSLTEELHDLKILSAFSNKTLNEN